MAEWILEKNEAINQFLWGPYILALFLFTGLLFTVGTGIFQLRHIRLWLRYTFFTLFKKEKKQKGCITQLQAMSTALAATVGTGNITGVAAALVTGGPGAVFWMWISAFLGMMTAYAENVLGILYRYRSKNGTLTGGAMVYMEKGLGVKLFAILFSLFCILASFGMGNMAQMHSVADALYTEFGLPPFWTGLLGAVLVAIIISGGLSRIARVTERLVPLMVVLFFAGSALCLFRCADKVIPAFRLIFASAFSLRSAGGGVLGYGISKAMRTGISRGVFSNEAGLGSSVSVHASSSVKEPVIQGMWGVFEVFVDTIIVCTITALVILTSGVYTPAPNGESVLTGVSLTAAAYGVGLGKGGSLFISVSIVFFAFATVLGWSCFGERSVEYLLGSRAIPAYKAVFVAMAALGAWSSMELVWGISDTFNALMAIPNLLSLLLLSGQVFKETKRFMNGPHPHL
ncbi:MAG: sodium:alanine symporter family protein [Ruminococcaceae bacterium]|nr:sodium:alanine symporter family protein [Oscillospiraceae bacterium]